MRFSAFYSCILVIVGAGYGLIYLCPLCYASRDFHERFTSWGPMVSMQKRLYNVFPLWKCYGFISVLNQLGCNVTSFSALAIMYVTFLCGVVVFPIYFMIFSILTQQFISILFIYLMTQLIRKVVSLDFMYLVTSTSLQYTYSHVNLGVC